MDRGPGLADKGDTGHEKGGGTLPQALFSSGVDPAMIGHRTANASGNISEGDGRAWDCTNQICSTAR